MPRPGYIICSASGALDGYSNLISMFNLIETVEIRPVKPGQKKSLSLLDYPLIGGYAKGVG
jgi:hypothetical protein